MFLCTRPSPQKIQRFITWQTTLPLSYIEIAATKAEPPQGYTIDHNRVRLGSGADVFERAVAAIRTWNQFNLGWVRIVPEGTPLEVGAIAAILTKHFGFWSLNACKVIYLIEDPSSRKFGFAYGTLKGHVEKGEERFTIEWNSEDDSVWYDILAFSKPDKPIVKLARPLARMLQRRFARESLARMKSLCSTITKPSDI